MEIFFGEWDDNCRGRTLFPAISLAIVPLNFRYTSLAGLMRNISSQIEAPKIEQSRQTILNKDLSVMRKRTVMVEYSLFFAEVSFILNLLALFFFLLWPSGNST